MGRGQGRVFALNPQEAQTATNVVIGTFTIEHMHARILFDSGATHSFISLYFAKKLSKESRKMENPLIINTPLQDSIIVDHMYPACLVEVENRKLSADLIELPVLEFDVILWMDWLDKYDANINCCTKRLVLRPQEEEEIIFQGDRSEVPTNLISVVKARRQLVKGCQGYLAQVIDARVRFEDIQQIPVVKEFIDVFLGELPGLPPERKVEFRDRKSVV